MPERLAYDDAMLFSRARLKIQDPDLKYGKVETLITQTNAGPVERPWGIEGGFAVVYKFRSASGALRALRCFRVPMNPDTQYRYERIDPYFHTHIHDITAGFHYHKEGIVVKELKQGTMQSQTYPIIEMDWIEGMTLLDKVDELCRKRDSTALKDLSNQWLTMLRRLQQAHIAHGDLAGLNVMVKANGHLVLIDYDGVYIPDFAGMTQLLLGQIDYQHHQMAQRPFGEHMDAFSALVISIALLALAAQPELWNAYTQHNQQGKLLNINLLFIQKDFLEPQQSPLFRDLEQSPEPRVKQLLQELRRACQQSIDLVRFPSHLLDPEQGKKLALAALLQAIQADDDEQIINSWSSLLNNYTPAHKYRKHFLNAEKRVKALQAFQNALGTGNIAQIVASYDPLLDSSHKITLAQRDTLRLAEEFLQAYTEDNDDSILKVEQDIQTQLASNALLFTPQEQIRITYARQRKQAQLRIHEALSSKQIEHIATTYTALKHVQLVLTDHERKQIELAADFTQADKSDDDDAILRTCQAIQNSRYHDLLAFTEEHEQRVQLAKQRKQALARLRMALTGKNIRSIADAYDPSLDKSKELLTEERERVNLALSFIQASTKDDDEALLNAYYALQGLSQRHSFLLTTEEQDSVTLAWSRQEAYKKFRTALAHKDPDRIVKDYDPMLDRENGQKRLTTAESECLRLAHSFVATRMGDEDAHLEAYDEIENSAYHSFFLFSSEDLSCIKTIQQHQTQLGAFRSAVKSYTDAREIISHYQHVSETVREHISDTERRVIEDCYRYLDHYELFQHTLQVGANEEIWQAYQVIQESPFLQLTSDEQDDMKRLSKERELQEMLKQRRYGQVLKFAGRLSSHEHKRLSSRLRTELSKATKNFIRRCEMEEVNASIRTRQGSNVLEVTCRWPEEDLVDYAVILWNSWVLPEHPGEVSHLDPTWLPMNRRQTDRVSTISIPIDRRSTSIHALICTIMYDTWRGEQYARYYLSKGVRLQAKLVQDHYTSKEAGY